MAKELLYILIELPKRVPITYIINQVHGHFIVFGIKDTIDAELVMQTETTNRYQVSAYDHRSFYFLGAACATMIAKVKADSN